MKRQRLRNTASRLSPVPPPRRRRRRPPTGRPALRAGEIYTKGTDRIEVILHPVGHVAGAADVELVNKHRRIRLFSGDLLSRPSAPSRRPPPPWADRHPRAGNDPRSDRAPIGPTPAPPRSTGCSFFDRIGQILAHGGSCLIPVFALGRMQEMFKILFEARNFGRLPRCPGLCRRPRDRPLPTTSRRSGRARALVDFGLRHAGKNARAPPDLEDATGGATCPQGDLPR